MTGSTALDRARYQFAGALQGALTLDEVTEVFMSVAGDVVPAHTVGVYRLDEGSGGVLDVRSDAAGSFLDDYERFGRSDDPVLDWVLRKRRPIDSTRAVTRQVWESSGARSALGDAGLEHSLEAPLCASGRLLGTVNFARAKPNRPFSDADLMSARIVSEQLGLAVERAVRFELTGHRTTLLERALDRVPQAVIVTDLDAQVLYWNRAARNDPEIIGADGEPHSFGPVEEMLAQAMAELRNRGKRVHVGSTRVAKSGSGRIMKSYRLGEGTGTAVTLVFDRAPRAEASQLPVWHVLTRREQDIAELVSEGLTTKQIAERAFISENTVKQHLKRVFAKTDVRNRAELIQLIWSAGGAPRSSPRSVDDYN